MRFKFYILSLAAFFLCACEPHSNIQGNASYSNPNEGILKWCGEYFAVAIALSFTVYLLLKLFGLIQESMGKKSNPMPPSNGNESISVEDIVSVTFHTAPGGPTTLTSRAVVKRVPRSQNEAWVFHDLETNDVHHVSEPCTITKSLSK